MREGIAAYFPEAKGPTRRMVACMFTTSPDEHFILDRHPAVDDAFIAAGFSGHGYKFCSVIGRIMADCCLGEEEKWGVEGLGWGRGKPKRSGQSPLAAAAAFLRDRRARLRLPRCFQFRRRLGRHRQNLSGFGIHADEHVPDRGLRFLEFDRSVLVNDLDPPAFRCQSVPAISFPQDLHLASLLDELL